MPGNALSMFVETDGDKTNIYHRHCALIILHIIHRIFLEAFPIAILETSYKELPETFPRVFPWAFPVLFPIDVSQGISQTLPYSLIPNPNPFPIQGSKDIH